jgi:hypothetical protein
MLLHIAHTTISFYIGYTSPFCASQNRFFLLLAEQSPSVYFLGPNIYANHVSKADKIHQSGLGRAISPVSLVRCNPGVVAQHG